MFFKNPLLLYALFLLLIPILVHLFHLQRFETVRFTNVRFLQQIEKQTRKSSRLKKWLLLITRLLLLVCLILAFAQPYIPEKESQKKDNTFIYLDNSLSMQAKGENGTLFEQAKQILFKTYGNKDKSFGFLTNDDLQEDLTMDQSFLNTDYSPKKSDPEQVLLRLTSLNSTKNIDKQVFIISDFQDLKDPGIFLKDTNTLFHLIPMQAKNRGNFSVDSIWISDKNSNTINLKVSVSNSYSEKEETYVTLWFNGSIQGKALAKVGLNSNTVLDFSVKNTGERTGKVVLDDPGLSFDNQFYFSIPAEKIKKIISIGAESAFLGKIFGKNEFDLVQTELKQLNLPEIEDYSLIILNELESVPAYLSGSLKNYLEKGGNVVIIPSEKLDRTSYTQLFKDLNMGTLNDSIRKRTAINRIDYEHPFFKNVFENREENFAYPHTELRYNTNLNSNTGLIFYEDNSTFLSKLNRAQGNLYWFSSPLNQEISNFLKSPLIVPTFFNFGLENFSKTPLFYRAGRLTEFSADILPGNEEVLHLKNEDTDFIPMQQIKTDKVLITTEDQPSRSGLYDLTLKNEVQQKVAYNYLKDEGKLHNNNLLSSLKGAKNIIIHSDLENAVLDQQEGNKSGNLWQLFIIFALIFLLTEIAIQLFMKN